MNNSDCPAGEVCLDGLCTTLPDAGPGCEAPLRNDESNWAVWRFDGSATSGRALAALRDRTVAARACTGAWNPIRQSGTMTDDPYHCDENNNDGGGCACFWYQNEGGVMSFYLDDDTGWAETGFGAGYDYPADGISLGVDSLELVYRRHTTMRGLWLAVR